MINEVHKITGGRIGSKDKYVVYYGGYMRKREFVCLPQNLPETVKDFIVTAKETWEPIGCYYRYR